MSKRELVPSTLDSHTAIRAICSDESGAVLMSSPYRRGRSVRIGSGAQHRSPNVYDGGRDAPLDEESNRWFKHIAIAIGAVGAVMIILTLVHY